MSSDVTILIDAAGADPGAVAASRASAERQTLAAEIVVTSDWRARLPEARTAFVGVLAAGDRMHPDRLRRLVAEAVNSGAAAVRDDMIASFRPLRAAPGPSPLARRESLPAEIGQAPDWLGLVAAAAGQVRRLALPLLLRGTPVPAHAREIAVLSRQRVSGADNGSSAYLLSVCAALKAAGWRLRFIGPSPAAFGRWPAIPLAPEMDVFDAIELRGSVRIGRRLVSRDARRALDALVAALAHAAKRIGLPSGFAKPAPYAIAAPLSRADALFVARKAQGCAAVLCDYAQLVELAPYAGAPAAALMHDLVHARESGFAALGGADSVARLSAAEEFRLLAQADAVVAIQPEEAAAVRRALPRARVIEAPMAAGAVAAPQPGADDAVLFVGGRSAPNADAVAWLLGEIWPRVRARRPNARLAIAGAAARTVANPPAGVRLLGPVRALAPLYAEAGIVVSPLRAGSGLKVKLVEAMAAGKAIVASPVTLQGVPQAADALVVAQDADAFAEAILGLAADRARRLALGAAALAFARRRFAPETSYAALRDWFDRHSRLSNEFRSIVLASPAGPSVLSPPVASSNRTFRRASPSQDPNPNA